MAKESRLVPNAFFLFFFSFIFVSWRLTTPQYCSGFCHTLTWISHGVTFLSSQSSDWFLFLCSLLKCLPQAVFHDGSSLRDSFLFIYLFIFGQKIYSIARSWSCLHTLNEDPSPWQLKCYLLPCQSWGLLCPSFGFSFESGNTCIRSTCWKCSILSHSQMASRALGFSPLHLQCCPVSKPGMQSECLNLESSWPGVGISLSLSLSLTHTHPHCFLRHHNIRLDISREQRVLFSA